MFAFFSEYGEASQVLFNNNMGILHHALGKQHLACHYFQTALKEDIVLWQTVKKQDSSKSVGCSGSDAGPKAFVADDQYLYIRGGCKHHEITYNLGIALLHAGRAAEAFDCLIFAVRRYHRNARLWLRVAECCIAVHKGVSQTRRAIEPSQGSISLCRAMRWTLTCRRSKSL